MNDATVCKICLGYFIVVIKLETQEEIRGEGISAISDLTIFDKYDITAIFQAVRRPGGTIPNPT